MFSTCGATTSTVRPTLCRPSGSRSAGRTNDGSASRGAGACRGLGPARRRGHGRRRRDLSRLGAGRRRDLRAAPPGWSLPVVCAGSTAPSSVLSAISIGNGAGGSIGDGDGIDGAGGAWSRGVGNRLGLGLGFLRGCGRLGSPIRNPARLRWGRRVGGRVRRDVRGACLREGAGGRPRPPRPSRSRGRARRRPARSRCSNKVAGPWFSVPSLGTAPIDASGGASGRTGSPYFIRSRRAATGPFRGGVS